jgi:type IV secretion system protein VirB9
MNYTFEDGALYEVFTAPLRLTSIQLQRGEVITGKPAAGDTVRWVVGVNQGNRTTAPHILVKPVEAGLKTSMVVNTNKRTYLLNLSSYPQTWMPAVRWQYPQDDYQRQLAAYNAAKAKREAEVQRRQAVKQRQQAQQRLAAKAVDVDNLNFAYTIQTPRFSLRPPWTPLQVFDDGRKTFIRFPKARQHTEAPALFVLSPQGELQLVIYRVQQDFYVVDRLFDAAELRVGQQRPRIVRIRRQG